MSVEAEVHTPLLYDDEADAADAALTAGLDAEAALVEPPSAETQPDPRSPRGWCAALEAEPVVPLPEADDELATYGRMGCVLSLLLLAYALARLCALGPFPDDAMGANDGGQLACDVFQLLMLGAVLAWLTGLTRSERFAYFRKRPVYALVFVGTGPVFAAIGEVPGLQISLANVGDWGGLAWSVMLLALSAVGVVVFWHARHATRVLTHRPRLAYLASRSALVLLILVLWLVMTASPDGRKHYEATHLHHWLIGFMLAAWGAFNHPLSATLLVVGAGIFVQGIGAYGFAWLFYTTPAGQWANAVAAGCVQFRGNASYISCAWTTAGDASSWGVLMCPLGAARAHASERQAPPQQLIAVLRAPAWAMALAPAAAVGSVSLQTQLDEDMRALVDNFEGMLRSAQISEPVRNAQERLQLQVHAARLVEAAQSLLRLTERLKRDALLCDFGGRVAASDDAARAAAARLAAAQEALRSAADAAAARLAAQADAGTATLAHVGLEAHADDARAELDPVTARLFAIASGVSDAR